MTFSEQIARLEELDKLRTQGSWVVSRERDKLGQETERGMCYVHIPHRVNDAGEFCAHTLATQKHDEAEFIATSANVITRLLADLKLAKTALEQYGGYAIELPSRRDAYVADETLAELERP